MADPKYANLAGIAYDQPDVYETKDLPEVDQNADIFEEESESVERLHISATTALSKFKGKSLDATNVDFSDRLSRRIRIGYNARSGDWELAGEGEKETPIQKYQRLQCELKELQDEVVELKELAKDESNKQPWVALGKQAEALSRQMGGLRLEEQLGTELVASLADPRAALFKKLLSQLEQVKAPPVKDNGGGQADGTAVTKFQLSVSPGQAQLTQSTRLADLEHRLARLEQVLGASPAKIARLNGGEQSLLATAHFLSSRAALLDSVQLDAAEGRLSALLARLDQVAEKTAAITGSSDPERDKKINELYELAKKAESLSQTLPQTLERMIVLQGLHSQGNELSKSVSEMESTQVQLMAKMRSNAEMLSSVEGSLKSSFTTIQMDIENLDQRVKALSAKK